MIGTKKTFSWLVGLKRGSVSAFLLVLVQDILKKRTEEVKLRNPQGIPTTSCLFLETKNPDIFPCAPILHVLAAPPSGKVCRLQTRHPRLREYIASAGLEVPGTEGGVELLADDD